MSKSIHGYLSSPRKLFQAFIYTPIHFFDKLVCYAKNISFKIPRNNCSVNTGPENQQDNEQSIVPQTSEQSIALPYSKKKLRLRKSASRSSRTSRTSRSSRSSRSSRTSRTRLQPVDSCILFESRSTISNRSSSSVSSLKKPRRPRPNVKRSKRRRPFRRPSFTSNEPTINIETAGLNRVESLSKNPFFNYLRQLRRQHFNLNAVALAKKAGHFWRNMSYQMKFPYIVMARKHRQYCLKRLGSKPSRFSQRHRSRSRSSLKAKKFRKRSKIDLTMKTPKTTTSNEV